MSESLDCLADELKPAVLVSATAERCLFAWRAPRAPTLEATLRCVAAGGRPKNAARSAHRAPAREVEASGMLMVAAPVSKALPHCLLPPIESD